MHEYDVALKVLLRESAGIVMRELAGVVTRWINVELPEVRNPRVDMLGETADGMLVHIELQSHHDPEMALRMAEYCLQVYRLYGRFPRQVVLYVGNAPPRMGLELRGEDFSFRYRLVDIRDLDARELLDSPQISDNVIAVLSRLGDQVGAVREIVGKLSAAESGRESYLQILMILAGLRELEQVVETEARKMPILNDILDHKVLGREYKKGREEGREEGRREEALKLLHRQIVKRFGPMPAWAETRLAEQSAAQLEELCERILDAISLEDMLK